MPPLTSWSALTSASVGIWGLGVEGTASLRRLQSMGLVPVLVDDHPGGSPAAGLDVRATGAGGLEALLACDVVIKSPGISHYRPEVAQLKAQHEAILEKLRAKFPPGLVQMTKLKWRATSEGHRGSPPARRHPTSGSSRHRVIRCPS